MFGIGEEGDGLKSFAEALGRVISLCTVVMASQETADSRWRLAHPSTVHMYHYDYLLPPVLPLSRSSVRFFHCSQRRHIFSRLWNLRFPM